MSESHWRPTATQASRQARAKLLADIRVFFADRGVLEVETPLLCHHAVTDVHIASFSTTFATQADPKTLYLQTSPEYAMKRLLAAGSGPIYQMSKAFRNGERGHQHNPEFTMLEWYRLGFTHHDLMDEMDAFLQHTIGAAPSKRATYQALFMQHLDLDPLTCDIKILQKVAQRYQYQPSPQDDHDTLLQFLFSHVIEPHLGKEAPQFVMDFPQSQAALAKVHSGDPPVAERFELYIDGTELANGFHELVDCEEQRRRFEQDQKKRASRQQPAVSIDPFFLAALENGLPACSGVALGVDRLLMIKLKTKDIADVINFPIERA